METICDNCDQPIYWLDWTGLIGGAEWVHSRSGGPECRTDSDRLLGSYAEPALASR